MKIIFTISISVLSFCATSQVYTTQFSFNNSSAVLNNNGVFFNNMATQSQGYEVPKNSMKHIIYSSAFWFGGKDINNQLKLAAPDLFGGAIHGDFWPGPLTVDGTASTTTNNSPSVWQISGALIQDHIENFNQPGYVIPQSIMAWPAHGDVSENESYYLAPFVDADGDGIYHPENGDYPCIKGDFAIYMILNDRGGVHESGGDPLGLEVHYMFYQYATGDELDMTTFVDVDIYNRGTQLFSEFITSFVVDGDLGGWSDDYIGTDIDRNLVYYYNDGHDENQSGTQGYGSNPPSFGIVNLSDDISSTNVYINGGDPLTPSQKYNLMNGKDLNGIDQLDDEGMPSDYVYYDDPNLGVGNSEIALNNPAGDRRSIISTKIPILVSGQNVKMSYAIVFDQGASNLESVTEMFAVCDLAQNLHDTLTSNCMIPGNLSIEGKSADKDVVKLFPNPSNDVVNIISTEHIKNVVVINALGQKLLEIGINQPNAVIDVRDLPAGTYFVVIETNLGMNQSIFVKND